jgi:mono/diheme cytochrome c family protein
MHWRSAGVAIVIGLLAAAASAQHAAPRGPVEEGHRLALTKCDACHIVAADQQFRPLLANYAPSFYGVANRATTDARSLEAYLSQPHNYSGMPYPDLTPAEVTALVSYILSLRGQQ